MSKKVRILSIDGGGIRGIIPAMILAEIEKQTNKPISSLFDLIAGTSTGGILAIGLTVPDDRGNPKYKAEHLVELYEKQGETIFSRSVWHRIRAVGSLVEEKYPSKGIESVLENYLGNARLKDVLTEVLVTGYEIERRIPWFFKSRYAKDKNKKGYDFPLTKVARSTSAAPTYFEPALLKTDNNRDYYAIVDGGVFANNPAMCAYAEAKSTHPQADDFLVVSLGTGEFTRPLIFDEVKGWGLAQWAQPILSVVFDGVSDTVDYQLKQLLEPNKQYYRFQTRLNVGNDDMDDASQTNIRILKLLAEALIRDYQEKIKSLCKQLVQSH